MTSTAKFTAQTVTWVHRWAANLFSFRTTRDPDYRFVAGQFARLGLHKTGAAEGDIVWRAYSMASAQDDDFLEFFAIVIPGGEFSSQLTDLAPGATVYVDQSAFGFLTVERFVGGSDLWMLSTGTGLSPFISILWDHNNWKQFEHLVLVHSVRSAEELAYRDLIEAFNTHTLFKAHGHKLKYLPVVTRESVADALNARLPQLIVDGRLEAAAGLSLDLERSRIMLCGNPDMVKDTRKTLAARGFTTSRRLTPGQLAVENYW